MLTTFAASVYSRVRPGRLPHSKKRIRHNRLAVEALERRELLAVIQGTVFEDLNGDGGLDASDPGFAGATVYLDQNQNGRFDDGEVTAQTGADGAYQLAVAEPGTYRVGQVVPSGWLQTSPGLPAGPETRGEVLTGWEAPAGRSLLGAAWAGGTLYVQHRGNPTAPIVHPVDPATGLVVGPSIPVAKPILEITFDGTCFWGVGYESDRPFLASFDMSGAVLSEFVLPSPITRSVGVEAAGQGRFWITDNGTDALYLVDSTTGTIERTLPAPTPNPHGIASDGCHLWVNDYAAGTVYQIDPATGATLDSFFVAGCSASSSSPGLRGLTFDGQNLWAVRYETEFEGQVLKLDIATPATAAVTIVDAAEAAIGPDFGRFQLATVSGQVVNDLDADGIRDPDEPPLADWWVAIDTNSNGRVDPWENATLSDTSGNYSLAGLRPGPQRVGEMLRQPGWVATLPAAGSWTVYPASGESLVRDFGNSLTGIGPIGGEVLVNSPTADIAETLIWPFPEVLCPREVAMDAAGNYVVTWQSGTEIRARHYDAAQGTFGNEFVVNTTTVTREWAHPIVAMASSTGNFVISWWNGADVLMRRYNSDATPASGEIVAVAGKCYGGRSIAMDADGDFALLYNTYYSNKSSYTLYLQRYNAAGQAQDKKPINVDTFRLINACASLGMDSAGNMVVVWDKPGVYAQRYSAAGKAVGDRITVGPEIRSNMAVNAAGEFAVVVGYTSNPYCKVYSATGALRTTFPCIAPYGCPPAVTWLPDGTLLIASWEAHDFSESDVFAQRYDAATGLPVDPQPFLVNTTLAGVQRTPSVAADAAGNFVIVWEGNGKGDSAGIFAQRYAAPPATAKSPLLAAERVDASVATLDQTATLTDLALQELAEAHERKAKPVLLPTQAAAAALLQNGLW